MSTIIRLFKKKVPLWALFLAFLVIGVETAQIITEFKSYLEQRSYYIQTIQLHSEGIYKNLEYFCANKDDESEADPALIGACHEARGLVESLYYIPKWNILGNKRDIHSGYDTQNRVTFTYTRSILEQMLKEYGKTGQLSDADYEDIQIFISGFRNLSQELADNPKMSNEQLNDCLNKLYLSVYCKEGKEWTER